MVPIIFARSFSDLRVVDDGICHFISFIYGCFDNFVLISRSRRTRSKRFLSVWLFRSLTWEAWYVQSESALSIVTLNWLQNCFFLVSIYDLASPFEEQMQTSSKMWSKLKLHNAKDKPCLHSIRQCYESGIQIWKKTFVQYYFQHENSKTSWQVLT